MIVIWLQKVFVSTRWANQINHIVEYNREPAYKDYTTPKYIHMYLSLFILESDNYWWLVPLHALQWYLSRRKESVLYSEIWTWARQSDLGC